MEELLALQQEFEKREEPYALATVVAVKGSASAKAGSKCLISREGKNIWGWVGGGCAESFTITNALEAMEEGVPRIITADLDDEVFGLGMPCGGVMEIYVEPRLPRVTLEIQGERSPALDALVAHYHFHAHYLGGKRLDAPAEILRELAFAIARARNIKMNSLTLGPKGATSAPPSPTELLILGHSRITQELAKLGALLGWPTRVYGIGMEKNLYPSTVRAMEAQPEYAGLEIKPGSFVVVASHHKGDHHYIKSALEVGAAYVGLVASAKRAKLVFDFLGGVENLSSVKSPAGLHLQCKNPGEIALSIIAELI